MGDGGISTDEILRIALDLAGMTAVPGDSAVYVAGSGLKRVMVGIDVGVAELLLARQLGVDGVIAHHPAGGSAVLDFPRVLIRGAELMTAAGVPADVARQTMQPAIARAMLRAQAANFDHVPSVARLLGVPFLNVHLPLDEFGRRVMDETIGRHLDRLGREPLVGDVAAALRTIPEIGEAPTRVMVPVGRLDSPAGRVVVFHGAGTNGGFAVAQTLYAHGAGTVVYIHLAPEDAERLRALPAPSGNVVVSGHIASDLIGVNRFLALLEERGVEVVRMSGVVQPVSIVEEEQR
jgi:putative NIF3 family GTP cyclohydrolase 1 type 2